MIDITDAIFERLTRPNPGSHKGQNGRVFVIAGSEKFHGAMLLVVQAASRICDMVYVHSVVRNLSLIEKLRSEVAVFIAVPPKEVEHTIQFADAIVIGPGLETTDDAGEEVAEATRKFVQDILVKHPQKKVVVDATALWHVDPKCLHANCIVTPHSREFQNVFQMEPSADNVLLAAKRFGGVVVLKGSVDFVSDGKDIYANHTGNVGMTKGGTGDTLAGIIGALATKNDILTSSLAGTYWVGAAGDVLYKKKNTFYNAEDVVGALGDVWREIKCDIL